MLLTCCYNYPSFSKPFVAHHLVYRDPFVAAYHLADRDAASCHLWYFFGDRHS